MDERSIAARLAALREQRVKPERAEPVAMALGEAKRTLARLERALGGMGEAWGRVCPEGLAAKATPVSLSRGVLTIGVGDAAARYEVDRWLRSGGEQALVATAPGTVRRVRIVLDGERAKSG